MTEVLLFCFLTVVASGIGTAKGFGTSTGMISGMVLFVPVPIALLFVGVIHLCGGSFLRSSFESPKLGNF